MDPVDWKVVTEKLSQLDIWLGESLESIASAAIAKGVKTEWVQVWANLICFAIYAVKSKQTYQTSRTVTMT